MPPKSSTRKTAASKVSDNHPSPLDIPFAPLLDKEGSDTTQLDMAMKDDVVQGELAKRNDETFEICLMKDLHVQLVF